MFLPFVATGYRTRSSNKHLVKILTLCCYIMLTYLFEYLKNNNKKRIISVIIISAKIFTHMAV